MAPAVRYGVPWAKGPCITCPGRGAAFFTVRRRAGTHVEDAWAPDQQRTTPQARRAAQHPGNEIVALPAPDRRHQHLVAAAGAAVDFLAGAELQVLAQADPHFAEAPAVAGRRNCRCAQARIDLDERRF